MPDKKTIKQAASILGSLSGKTLNLLQAYIHGSTFVVELGFSDGTTSYVKYLQGQVEMGGTNEWGTGTRKL